VLVALSSDLDMLDHRVPMLDHRNHGSITAGLAAR
jgi:hypothetical protein